MRTHRTITCALAAATALAGASDASAATASKRCAPQKGTIVKRSDGRVWHRGADLYACTEGYGKPARTHRMGPWTATTKVAFDGANLAWTVRMTKEGKPTDRVWAGEASLGYRWTVAQKPNPAGATLAAREDRVQGLLVSGTAVMWTTKGSSVVAALRDPVAAPETIGTLPAAPVRQGHLTMVGTFPDVPAAVLAASMKLDTDPSKGDGDECGGTDLFRFTVKPGADAAETGISWFGGYERPDCG